MISSKLFGALQQRGLHQALNAAQLPFHQAPVRFFSSNNKQEESEAAAAEPEAAPEPKAEPKPKAQAAPKAKAAKAQDLALDKALFQPFSLGGIRQIDSTPDHRPPSQEDTIEGRYSGVLFTTASQNGELYKVYEDMKYLMELYKHSDQFRLFTENAGVGVKEVAQFNEALQETAPFSKTTLQFLTVLAENKRLNFIEEIADKYGKLYQEFNKEEKITIISAMELSKDQKSQVVAALEANPQNEGKQFTIDYEVDDTILGGLQMYTESEFMDMSLASRMTRIENEVSKLGN